MPEPLPTSIHCPQCIAANMARGQHFSAPRRYDDAAPEKMPTAQPPGAAVALAAPIYHERIAALDGIDPPTTGLADIPPGPAAIREHLVAAGRHVTEAQRQLARNILVETSANTIQDLRDALHAALDEAAHAAAALRLQAMAAQEPGGRDD